MRPRPESVDAARIVGYLADDNLLYCSAACAAASGASQPNPVDQDEYEALVGRGLERHAGCCPACGSEFPIDWQDEER